MSSIQREYSTYNPMLTCLQSSIVLPSQNDRFKILRSLALLLVLKQNTNSVSAWESCSQFDLSIRVYGLDR